MIFRKNRDVCNNGREMYIMFQDANPFGKAHPKLREGTYEQQTLFYQRYVPIMKNGGTSQEDFPGMSQVICVGMTNWESVKDKADYAKEVEGTWV
jgi:hypothetical protein